MLVNLAGISDGESKAVDISGPISLSDYYNLHDNNVIVTFCGVIAKEKDKYNLTGNIQADLVFNCDKCLEPVSRRIELALNEVFLLNGSDDCEYWPVKAGVIDVSDCFRANIACNMPMRVLCSDECKGLCPYCGQNLNLSVCGCKKPADPRFKELSSFFDRPLA